MKIIFDYGLNEKDSYAKFSPQEKAAIQTIDELICNRLLVYEKDIDQQEMTNAESMIVVNLLNSPKTIQPKKYPPYLAEKITARLDQKFLKNMWRQVEENLVRFFK